MNNTIPPTDNTAYKSLLYWRKNLWNGAACVPVILMLEDGVLTMKSADDTTVFNESLEKVAVNFTGWGTMVLTMQGKKYDIVGMPAADSPAISDLQKAELSGLKSEEGVAEVKDAQPVVLGGTAASATGNAGATVVGAAISSAAYYRGLTSIREWKSLIGSQEDQKKSMSYMTYFIALVAIGLVAALVLKELNT